ncbi:unnamed protein product [Laminaria digitata]
MPNTNTTFLRTFFVRRKKSKIPCFLGCAPSPRPAFAWKQSASPLNARNLRQRLSECSNDLIAETALFVARGLWSSGDIRETSPGFLGVRGFWGWSTIGLVNRIVHFGWF